MTTPHELIAEHVCQSVAEIPDRSSPDDAPDMMLVTADELHTIVLCALESQSETGAALTSDGGRDADVHARCTDALIRHRGCDVPKDRDWSSVQFGEIAAEDVRVILAALAQPVEAGEDGLREAMRQQGQREGKAAVCQWLRGRGAMRPPAVLHHAAGILAGQFEQSEIPGANQ